MGRREIEIVGRGEGEKDLNSSGLSVSKLTPMQQILKSIYFYFRCMNILFTCMFVHCVHAGCPQRPERASDPLKLELETVASYYVGSRN